MLVIAHAEKSRADSVSVRSSDLRSAITERVDRTPGVGISAGWIDGSSSGVVSSGPVNADTLFEIGSVTKTFTATILADMVLRGEVKATTPVGALLPTGVHAPERNGKAITLGDLAMQTSGLPRLPTNIRPRDINNPYADYTTEDLYHFLDTYQLPRDPGTEYEYSNLGFALLGQLLARRAGTSFDTLLAERVLEPIGMTSSQLSLTEPMRARLAAPHDADGRVTEHWDDLAFSPAGALHSSVHDMLRYLTVNMNGSQSEVARACRLAQEPRHAGPHGGQIGFAWNVTADKRYIWHNGATGGYWAFVGFDRTAKRGVVLLSNRFISIDDIGWHYLDPTRPVVRPEGEIAVDAHLLDRYVGTYADLSRTVTLVVRRVGDLLAVQMPDSPDSLLHAATAKEFFLRSSPERFIFETDDRGQLIDLLVKQRGSTIRLRRIADHPGI